MKQLWKKGIAATCAVVAMVSVTPISAFAIEPDGVQVLAIGDDCLLSADGTKTVADYLADYLGGTAVTRAEIGLKASDLVTELQSDASLKTEIKEADVILVSIGMNDLISPILYENTDLIDASQCSTLKQLANSITREDALLLDARLYKTMPSIVAQANTAVTSAVNTIRQQNSAANVVVQTASNPLAVNFTEIGVSTNRQAAISQLYAYLDVCLQGGTTSGGAKISTGLNQTIAGLSGVQVSDFYAPYVGAAGEEAMGFFLSDISNLNMRFTPIGQVLMAAAAVNADEQLSNGDGSIISAAYTATGKQSELAAERAAMDQMIQAASNDTKTSYALGDVDSDGTIGINDAFLTLQESSGLAVGNLSTMGPTLRRAADADGDSSLTIRDAFLWLQYSSMVAVGQDVDLETYLKEHGRS